MLAFIARRLLLSIPTLFGVLVVVFLLLYVAPGDPVQEMVGERADSATIARLRKELERVEAKLANREFRSKAPALIVAKEEQRAAELRAAIDRLS